MTSNQDTILEEEISSDEPIQNNFKSKLSNVIRRSKRFMSKRESLIEKENEATNECNTSQSSCTQKVSSTQKDPVTIGNGRKISQTVFSHEQQILIDGKAIKQVEVIGEKSPEPMDSKKNKKLIRKKSTDNVELNIACRNLGNADFEGWLMKKAGGHGLRPLSWKKYWCVVKSGNIYCYKTSFDIAADYAIPIKNFSIEDADEKKKVAFRMKPQDEVTKPIIFAGENEAEIKKWMEKLNMVISGIDISENKVDTIPDYEDRKRVYSTNHQKDVKRHAASSFSSETTGMPGGVSTRSSSISNPRTRLSSSSAKPETCLAVGSMFSSISDIEVDTPTKDVPLNEIFPQVAVEVNEAEMKKKADLERLNAEIAKLNADMLVLNSNGELKSFSLPSKAPESLTETKIESNVEKGVETKEESTEESKGKVVSIDKMLSPSNFVDEDTINVVVKDEDKNEIHNILSNLQETEIFENDELNITNELYSDDEKNKNFENNINKPHSDDEINSEGTNSILLDNIEEVSSSIEVSKTEEISVVAHKESYDAKSTLLNDGKSGERVSIIEQPETNIFIHTSETEKTAGEFSEISKTEDLTIHIIKETKPEEFSNVFLLNSETEGITSILSEDGKTEDIKEDLANVSLDEFQYKELSSVLDKQVEELSNVLDRQVKELNSLSFDEEKEEVFDGLMEEVSSLAVDNEKLSSENLHVSETISLVDSHVSETISPADSHICKIVSPADLHVSETNRSVDLHISETVVISDKVTELHNDNLNSDVVLTQATDFCETTKTTIDNQNFDLKPKDSLDTLQVHLDSSNSFKAMFNTETGEDEKNSDIYQSDNIAAPYLPEASNMGSFVDENDNRDIQAVDENDNRDVQPVDENDNRDIQPVTEYSNRFNESDISGEESFTTVKESAPALIQSIPDNTSNEFVEAENFPLQDETNALDIKHFIPKVIEPKFSEDTESSADSDRDTDSSAEEDEKDIINNENKDLVKSYDQEEKSLASLLSSYENNKRALSLNFGDDLEIPSFIDTSLSDDIAIQLITNSPNKSESLGYFTSVETSS